jgi:hypothetical protein
MPADSNVDYKSPSQMERVLEYDLRCENLGFSVIIFSDRGLTQLVVYW